MSNSILSLILERISGPMCCVVSLYLYIVALETPRSVSVYLWKCESWNGDENKGRPRIDFSEMLQMGVVETGADWLCNSGCGSKLASVWRRMTDVSKLTSNGPGLGFGDDRSSYGGICVYVLWVGYRNGVLLAILNEGILDGICNVACFSFYGLIRFFLIQ